MTTFSSDPSLKMDFSLTNSVLRLWYIVSHNPQGQVAYNTGFVGMDGCSIQTGKQVLLSMQGCLP